MKKRNSRVKVVMALMFCAGMYASCTKPSNEEIVGIPEGALMIAGETYKGDTKVKVVVKDKSVAWEDRDNIMLGSSSGFSEHEITVASGRSFVHSFDIPKNEAFYGYYPKSLNIGTGSMNTSSFTVTLPSVYNSTFTDGWQKLESPVVGYCEAGGKTMYFMHLTASLNVMITNSTGGEIAINAVTVKALTNGTYLGGGDVTVSGLGTQSIASVSPLSSGADSVRVNLATSYSLSNGSTLNVQVPIAPISSGTQLQIVVYGEDKSSKTIYFSNTQPGGEPDENGRIRGYATNSLWGGVTAKKGKIKANLSRNQMVPVSVSIEEPQDGGVALATFTVNKSGKTVKFSKGNLQYTTTGTHKVSTGGTESGTWRFATNQYDYIGGANANISSSYTGYIDLFCWGTSGWKSAAKSYQPYSTSTSADDYMPDGTGNLNITGNYKNADWGVYNAISNGGNEPNQWRVLSGGSLGEWNYLINGRPSIVAKARYAKVYIDGTSYIGLIIFPDNQWYISSESVTVGGVHVGSVNESGIPSTSLSPAHISTLTKYGCVFLPAAGRREGTNVEEVGKHALYWSSSRYWSKWYANTLSFYRIGIELGNTYNSRYTGSSVRLVQD